MKEDLADRFAIRELIENWVIWRDSGQWDRLASTFHPEAMVAATWQTGPAAGFIAGSKAAWEKGVKVLHTLSGCSIDLASPRAIAQTKMAICQRAQLQGAWVDVTCRGRFYDFLEKRNGCWALLLRQPIYEQDRIDPVDPAATITLDTQLLTRFPEGYRHLAYVQSAMGFNVNDNLPGRRGAEV